MKRSIKIWLCVALSTLVFIIGFSWLKNDLSAQQPRQIDAVILTCAATRPPLLEVQSYTGSARAPSIIIGTNCAQALAELLSTGFRIRRISRDLLMYTLIKADYNWVWM
jgi:hypothetical protein